MINKKHSEETKKKMSESAKGNKAFLGKKHTDEWKKKMSKPRPSMQGRIPWNKGKGKFATKQERQFDRNLRRYGLNEKSFNELLTRQNNVCAVCLKAETKKHQNGKVTNLSIDHCHTTGKVRGLLCSKCNFAIGHLDDNPYLCERAMKYLLTNQ